MIHFNASKYLHTHIIFLLLINSSESFEKWTGSFVESSLLGELERDRKEGGKREKVNLLS